MKYPVGIQTFDKIIEGGFVYVDKTDLIYSLVKEGTIYFFKSPTTVWEESPHLHVGKLFPWEERALQRLGDREVRKGVERISCVPC